MCRDLCVHRSVVSSLWDKAKGLDLQNTVRGAKSRERINHTATTATRPLLGLRRVGALRTSHRAQKSIGLLASTSWSPRAAPDPREIPAVLTRRTPRGLRWSGAARGDHGVLPSGPIGFYAQWDVRRAVTSRKQIRGSLVMICVIWLPTRMKAVSTQNRCLNANVGLSNPLIYLPLVTALRTSH